MGREAIMLQYIPHSFGGQENAMAFLIGVLVYIGLLSLFGYIDAETREGKKNVLVFFFIFGSMSILSLSLIVAFPYRSVSEEIKEVEIRAIQENKHYLSQIQKEDCALCGTVGTLSFHGGEKNPAIVNLNTFEYLRLEINRYDMSGVPIEEPASYIQPSTFIFQDGTGAYLWVTPNNGYADGIIELAQNSTLSFDRAAEFLCPDCLRELLNQYADDEEHWNIALLDFETRTIRLFKKTLTGFALGAFNVRFRHDTERNAIEMTIWYSPKYD